MTIYPFNFVIVTHVVWQRTENFGGVTVSNGPTDDEAEIIQHDQLDQQTEEEHEVKETCPRYNHSSVCQHFLPLAYKQK